MVTGHIAEASVVRERIRSWVASAAHRWYSEGIDSRTSMTLYRHVVVFSLSLGAGALASISLAQGADARPAASGARVLKVVDYQNPMHLDPKLLDEGSSIDVQPGNRQYDYYKSKGTRKWAEHYHMKPGFLKLKEGDHKGAYYEFAFVLRYMPNHPQALSMLGDMAIRLGRIDEADTYFKKSFKVFPETARASSYKDYGRFLYLAKNYTAAVQALEKSLQMDPKLSEARFYLGLTYFAMSDLVRANREAQIIYAAGFPLSELREKLVSANAWSPANPAPMAVGQDKSGVGRKHPGSADSNRPAMK